MSEREREWVVWHSMKNEFGQCSWCLTKDRTLYVRTHLGTKATQLGWHPPDLLARILMREIYNERQPGHTD
jgi:hypothetical protein